MDAFIGEVRYFAFGFAPQNWAACDGATVPVQQNMALFALLGTRYGGDGTTDFALPRLPAADGAPAAYICLNGIFPPRP